MATKKHRAKRAPKKRASKATTHRLPEPIAAARLDFLEFLKKADPDAPELR